MPVRVPALLALALLAACGPSGNDPGPGGVSVDEARALDEAAEMIEARRLPPGTLATDDTEQDQGGTASPTEETTR